MATTSKKHNGLKIMIGVDFEGITDVVIFDEIYNNHPFFERNAKQLTAEVNAAIEGAFEAGATEIVVRDGHGGDQNCIPALLNKKVLYANGRKPGSPDTMVIGIDETYDALIFIGAHAMAGKKNGVLSHTMSRTVIDYKINGRSIGECPYNAMYAAQFGVPVIMIVGDDVTEHETKEFFGNIGTVITKKAIGRTAALNKHPQIVLEEIKEVAKRVVSELKQDLDEAKSNGNLSKLKKGEIPYRSAKLLKVDPPYKMEVWLSEEKDSDVAVKHVEHTSDSLIEVMQKFWDNI